MPSKGVPAYTIITPLLNRAAMLVTALESAARQGSDVAEHIVVDGGSTDGSQSIAAMGGCRVIEAPGSSIYEAINLGVDHAQGDILCLLNSDDRLADGALWAGRQAFASYPGLELVRGRASTEGLDGTYVKGGDLQSTKPNLRNVLFGASNINACLIKTSLARRVGPFNPTYRISADREWMVRALLAGASVLGIDDLIYFYRAHPGSLTIGPKRPAAREWVREHLAFARALLATGDLEPSERADLRAFFAKETVHLAALSLSEGDPTAAADALTEGFRIDAIWPLRAAGPLASIARRRLGC